MKTSVACSKRQKARTEMWRFRSPARSSLRANNKTGLCHQLTSSAHQAKLIHNYSLRHGNAGSTTRRMIYKRKRQRRVRSLGPRNCEENYVNRKRGEAGHEDTSGYLSTVCFCSSISIRNSIISSLYIHLHYLHNHVFGTHFQA
jgi:hypothetical protein